MWLAARRFALHSCAAASAAALVLSPSAAADPDIDSQSAIAVIEELQEQGYTVVVNGVPGTDVSLLASCIVTKIHNPGDPTTDPTTSTTVDVEVACPISYG